MLKARLDSIAMMIRRKEKNRRYAILIWVVSWLGSAAGLGWSKWTFTEGLERVSRGELVSQFIAGMWVFGLSTLLLFLGPLVAKLMVPTKSELAILKVLNDSGE
jgi:hypothetical protein